MPRFWEKDGDLTPLGKTAVRWALCLYALAICAMCFLPQPFRQVKTPGIQHYGRLVVLLTPFNSLVNFGKINSFWHLLWILGQNISNILLLYPLILSLLLLKKELRSLKRTAVLGFSISLFIEVSQLLLDFLFNVNRVFEIDDLWTNTLGSILAFYTCQWLQRKITKQNGSQII
ncbi:VanZ family protein [Streptococcus caviae]|uniref:VanZ family protein n=1 Tax=Streptococcus sp. 'caviae' TaxID=1915004 RepID=UPI00094B8879|nr:VanZ family protein [Streptococcus sp. 'caviae']OLN84019.1 hypothetical protein BMI76_02140 [Streptococcus sp. 'caviae']